jgi:hypothetical protein
MSTLSGGPNVVMDGLVLWLDAANTKSYVSGSTTWNDISREAKDLIKNMLVKNTEKRFSAE